MRLFVWVWVAGWPCIFYCANVIGCAMHYIIPIFIIIITGTVPLVLNINFYGSDLTQPNHHPLATVHARTESINPIRSYKLIWMYPPSNSDGRRRRRQNDWNCGELSCLDLPIIIIFHHDDYCDRKWITWQYRGWSSHPPHDRSPHKLVHPLQNVRHSVSRRSKIRYNFGNFSFCIKV